MTAPAHGYPTRQEMRQGAELDLDEAMRRVARAFDEPDPAVADKFTRIAQVSALSAVARALLILGMDEKGRGQV